ncbi:MAG: IS5 family transposase [Butyrivibrio sp.]|nr:IS5 family transposase [Butyrivibrio sp.]
MYKFNRNHQFSLSDFNQPIGLKMNPENRWVKKSEAIPWYDIEQRYASLFPSNTGMPAKPLQAALGSLLIQKQYGYSDRELVEQIRENPYYQFFIGLPGYQENAPFVPSLLVEFRKRLTDEVLSEINEMIAEYNHPDDHNGDGTGGDDSSSDPDENQGTLILDATCAPQQISYPQDINLLNEARENLEAILDTICYEYNYYKPRMYRENARKDYLALAKCRKRSAKKIRKAVKKQLQYVRRDLGYIDLYLEQDDIELTEKQAARIDIIRKLFEQQEYMYKNGTHSVKDRIVSISQPYIRPIVRGKAKSPTEFGAKLDMSIDENGIARLERLSFDAYNESDVLIGSIKKYFERTGHYPERVLVDQIYRNRRNRAFCRELGIRMSGPALGRPKQMTPEAHRQSYNDNVDRIEVERGFSLAKRCYGLGLIRTKLDTTTRSSIGLSIIAMNLDRLTAVNFVNMLISIFSRYIWQNNLPQKSIESIMACDATY